MPTIVVVPLYEIVLRPKLRPLVGANVENNIGVNCFYHSIRNIYYFIGSPRVISFNQNISQSLFNTLLYF